MTDAWIVGASSTRFERAPDKSYRDLAREAYCAALADAGMETGDAIEFGWFSNCGLWVDGQASIRGQVLFAPLVRAGLFPERVPMVNVEAAAPRPRWRCTARARTSCPASATSASPSA